ncbi:Similar to Pre-mRNA-splicing factor SPF27; acc. no. Q6PBE2 [Pyronema omphalodes CBS 100304]|uniref:Similar to Pre-mRNA-splicing factor SPF27 acc. no. Q6PBE2 n=1 Tax=Pyronema omphalodes (strain CBS 100304) TaxID=1076935 RepID=U4KXV1_PYROM|nr:Similar to Pre-mRNA-splicing factor SPF27; acc. no. Q6PBE2 [Pyronema omphalodes CBS 100304]
MPLFYASHDSLPSHPHHRALRHRLIPPNLRAQRHGPLIPPHLLPEAHTPSFSPAISTELDRISRGEPFTGGIDLSRYNPSTTSPDLAALQSAYTSFQHVSSRLTNLSLLSEFGKNAWLIHNSQLEGLLKSLEEELMALKTNVEVTNKERKGAQLDVKDQMERLDERWKKAVGRVLEVELATEQLRREGEARQRERR